MKKIYSTPETTLLASMEIETILDNGSNQPPLSPNSSYNSFSSGLTDSKIYQPLGINSEPNNPDDPNEFTEVW